MMLRRNSGGSSTFSARYVTSPATVSLMNKLIAWDRQTPVGACGAFVAVLRNHAEIAFAHVNAPLVYRNFARVAVVWWLCIVSIQRSAMV